MRVDGRAEGAKTYRARICSLSRLVTDACGCHRVALAGAGLERYRVNGLSMPGEKWLSGPHSVPHGRLGFSVYVFRCPNTLLGTVRGCLGMLSRHGADVLRWRCPIPPVQRSLPPMGYTVRSLPRMDVPFPKGAILVASETKVHRGRCRRWGWCTVRVASGWGRSGGTVQCQPSRSIRHRYCRARQTPGCRFQRVGL